LLRRLRAGLPVSVPLNLAGYSTGRVSARISQRDS
jgi:hypothetical protein